jgi:hypothetical protein
MSFQKQSIDLFVRLPNGNGCQFTVSDQATCHQLARLIEKTGLHLPDAYRFVIKGSKVKDYSLKLADLGLRSNGIVHIQPEEGREGQRVKVDVAFLLKGDKFVVRVPLADRVWELKVAISSYTGIPPRDQILVFFGRKLKDNHTLRDYQISSDSLLCLILAEGGDTSISELRDGPSNKIDMVNSMCSLNEKRSGETTETLFRSDSINKKNS